MILKIKGEIGWDVYASDIERKLSYATGDVEIEIDSPGGSVFEGISIANAIRNYKGGNVTIKVIFAASMATYIMLFGNKLVFCPDAAVMIHNPSTVAWGDYRAMESCKSLLEKLTNMFREQYAKFTGLNYETFAKAMDDETWYIGKDELNMWGEVLESELDAQDVEIVKASCMDRIQLLKQKMTNDYIKSDLEKVAKMQMFASTQMVNNSESVKEARLKRQEGKMDLNELKSKYPDVYAQVKAEGFNEGVAGERQRVQDHLQFVDIVGAKDLVLDAINSGTSFSKMVAKYTRLSLNAQTIKSMEDGSPDPVNPDEANDLQQGAAKDAEQSMDDEIKAGLASIGLEVK